MAMDLFIKIGSLEGEGEDAEFNKWIDVLAWSWGGSQSGTAVSGCGMGGGKVNMQNFSFTKYTDIVSPKLWGQMSTGKHFDKVQFKARKSGGKPFVYLDMEFEFAILTAISTGGSGGEDRTTENVTFDYKTFKLQYFKQSKDTGESDGDDQFKFDIAQNIEVA